VYVAGQGVEQKGSRQEHPIHHLTLLAKNETGYRHLMKLTSLAHLEGFHYKPRIDFAMLSRYADGLICLSGCMVGELAQHILKGRDEDARALALQYKELFGADYFFEMQDHQLLEQRKVNQRLLQWSKELEIPLVATNDVHYVQQEDAQLQDLLLCIGTNRTMDDPQRMRMQSDQMYMKSADEMALLFPHVPQALANTVAIADRCELELPLGQTFLPTYQVPPEHRSAADYLQSLCRNGLTWRYGRKSEWQEESFRSQAEARLDYELSVIVKMGFADYFLIVWDLLRFAHERGIAVGPGRGSSAGSLVAYVLNITNVDPLHYRLLFERFLNPERISLPDIDMDLSDERRGEVIAYATERYGADRVAQIATFGTMAARSAVRDVARVLEIPLHEVDKVARLLGEKPGDTIAKALASSAELRQLTEQSENARKMIQWAQKLEGMPRNLSTHAAGIVIGPDALTNYVPLQQGAVATPLTQYSMEFVEAVGLVKIDFLGLRTLSVLERTLAFVKRDYGVEVDFSTVPDDDARTYEMLANGDTLGVFQLESAGMRRVLREMKPNQFEDLISVLALYRPGPMEFIPKYIDGKHGRLTVTYPHANLQPILRDTYGIIVYQEQIMQIASLMAGFSLGQADLLRRAVSKKKREILDEQRTFFVAGSVRQGYTETEANTVYDMIVRFADYGFPRAHATAYAVLAFQTAYLRAHYPVSFMTSMMTAVIDRKEKVAEYAEACKTMNIRVLQPDVNESGEWFTASREGSIRFGLAAIKNVGFQAIEAIIRERAERRYEDLVDFCRRIDLRVCNKRVIESLILSGAMDGFGRHRAQLIAVLDEIVDEATKWKKSKLDYDLDLFGFTVAQAATFDYPEVRPFEQRFQLEQEKELLGLFLSGHPLDQYAPALAELPIVSLEAWDELEEKQSILTAGLVLSIRTLVTKKGQPMAFVELENKVMSCEVIMFSETWARDRTLVREGELCLIAGKLQRREDKMQLVADRVLTIEQARQTYQKSHHKAQPNRQPAVSPANPARDGEAPSNDKLFIKVAPGLEGDDTFKQLETILSGHRGRVPVVLVFAQSRQMVQISDSFRVRPNARLIRSLESLYGEGHVKLS
jgi:DNA polymerase-3 subunit alpha